MRVRLLSPLMLVVFLSSISAAFAQVHGSVEVSSAVRHDVSQPLRNVEANPKANVTLQADAVLQPRLGASSTPITSLNFDGLGNGFAGPQGSFVMNDAVPDTNGAAGATQYVQWVNQSFAVFDKATGAVIYGPAAGNSLWTGFGGQCESTNNGDPIVQYDKAAARWVMTQFAGTASTSYYQCVAVSTTSDATGSYYRYAFPQPYLNDYAKLAVWPDAYYVTANMYSGSSFIGARACALDRTNMLIGAPATQQCNQFLSSVASLLPSDLDGTTPPPAGSPNYITQ